MWLLPAGSTCRSRSPQYHELAGDLEGKTAEEALAAVLNDPRRLSEYVETPWLLEIDRVLWQHDDPDGLARAIHGVVDDWPIPDRELLRKVSIPTRSCIEGTRSIPAELGRILADLLPNAELIEFASQQELFERIPELVARVSSFIAGNGWAADPLNLAMSELEEFRAAKDAFFRDDRGRRSRPSSGRRSRVSRTSTRTRPW